ncbi:cupin domain-containing protein [Lysinibacillus sp. NPDC093197]|uniref:cupin domain-containing protein n=1 Tax=Lysinibacillus sp. NPDC093197 TaxID=3364132 RepID=UPI003806194A
MSGAVLPHYQEVAEVIITKGKVKLLQNGDWKSYKGGDTFVVPKGVVHTVTNYDIEPTERVSIFIQVHEGIQNENFASHIVESEK